MTQTPHSESNNLPPHQEATTLRAVFSELAQHPVDLLLRRWNWKAALLSGIFRGAIFFATNLPAGWRAATAAMATQFVYRALTSGVFAAMAQAFRKVEPAWQATIAVMFVLPVITHLIEGLIHYARGTANLRSSLVVSVLFTALSSVFNLFAMRRGALLVGEAQASLAQDMRRMPGIVLAFLLFPLKALWRALKSALRGKAPDGNEKFAVVIRTEDLAPQKIGTE